MNKPQTLATLLLISTAIGAGPALSADLPSGPTPAPTPAPPSTNAYLLNLLFTGEAWDNTQGGLRTGAAFMWNMDGQLQVDTGKAFGWTGGTFEAEVFGANATSFGNSYIGAVDQQSPIDTAANMAMFHVYQLFYDQNFGATDVRFGIYDLETEFANSKPMALFLSKNLTWATAFDQSGTMPLNGTIGPGNYPYTPLALRVRESFNKDFSVQVAIANGAADNPNNLANTAVMFSPAYGAMFVGEGDYTPDKHTKLFVGAWDLTALLPEFGQYNADGSQKMIWNQAGAYVGGAARIYSQDPKRGLDAFATYGASTPQSTNVVQSLNAGLVYTGLLDIRPGDKAGISFNINDAASGWRQYMANQGMQSVASEESFEITYRAKINEYLTIQPDIQYIVNPGYNTNLKNPLALGFHFEIGHVFEW
jgi:porin